MTNDKLEQSKRTTLSVNQGIVSVVATSMGYSVDNLLGKQVDKFARRFEAVNHGNKDLKLWKGGIKAAASMMVFGTMYRYIAPVLVTPIANSIGNRIQAKKEAKSAADKVQAKPQAKPQTQLLAQAKAQQVKPLAQPAKTEVK